MRRGGRILVMLGIILGLVTAAGTFLVLSTQQPQAPQVQTRAVVIAIQNISARAEIPAETLGIQQWPEPVPPGAFEKISDVTGKLAVQPVYQGQIILPQMVIDKSLIKESRSNASYVIPAGKVAMAYSIDPLSSVANAIQAGDTVDLMLTLNPASAPAPSTSRTTVVTTTTGAEGQPVTQLMLQDVLILQIGDWNAVPAAAGNQQQAAPAASIVTFVLDRQDALVLKSAREQGTIEFLLRPAGDHKLVTLEPVTLQYLNKRFNFNLLSISK
jgi:pilus assembly protein CpaB